MKRIKHDDSNLIWFDYNTISAEELDSVTISNFDITNIPTKEVNNREWNIKDIVILPNFVDNLKNYYVTYFKDPLSKTGYSCMCLNKNREIYKSHIGYTIKDNRYIPEFLEY